MNVLFLGYGKMGRALGDTWLKHHLVTKLVAVDPHLESDSNYFFNKQAEVPTQSFDLVILAVKPNLAKTVLQDINPAFLNNACIISVMAGVEISSINEMINNKPIPIVRVMPNTPVLVQAGCCAIYTSSDLNNDLKQNIDQLFSSVGYSVWLDNEDDLHAVTAVSGSGPAYFHLFTEAIAEVGVKLGLSVEIANALAKQTAYGASLLQNQSHADLVELRKNVTSPNGTTHAAIQVFEENSELRKLTDKALKAANDRSIELSKA